LFLILGCHVLLPLQKHCWLPIEIRKGGKGEYTKRRKSVTLRESGSGFVPVLASRAVSAPFVTVRALMSSCHFFHDCPSFLFDDCRRPLLFAADLGLEIDFRILFVHARQPALMPLTALFVLSTSPDIKSQHINHTFR